ncbi:hypothetical protein HO133_002870 [Letharia lupina]|uniref:Uncharacterized protein n=1 Tax=Letharia lupina TaxID=560253 RepID=A0A8H6CBE8_9LECA|nr:uncharacterized protein HO133_002870 [Letharia lupina]KAF6220438.1 hypothetical protein HO133_002870 [Letharia lupina]
MPGLIRFPTHTVPTASTTDLAPELISQVFRSIEDFPSAKNLSKTSHKFQAVWQQDIDQVSYAIIQQSIECTHQVYEYLSASIEVRETILRGDKRDTAIARTRAIIDRVSNADEALSIFVKFVSGQSSAEAAITPTTRRDFIKAYHRIWTLATLVPRSTPYKMIMSMDALELVQLEEVLNWTMMSTNDFDRAELGYSYNFRDFFTPADYSEAAFYTWNHVHARVLNVIGKFTLLIDGAIFQALSGEKGPESCNALMYDT